jgi:uncharacterized protein YceK
VVFYKNLMDYPLAALYWVGFVYGVVGFPFDFCVDTLLLPVDLLFAEGE